MVIKGKGATHEAVRGLRLPFQRLFSCALGPFIFISSLPFSLKRPLRLSSRPEVGMFSFTLQPRFPHRLPTSPSPQFPIFVPLLPRSACCVTLRGSLVVSFGHWTPFRQDLSFFPEGYCRKKTFELFTRFLQLLAPYLIRLENSSSALSQSQTEACNARRFDKITFGARSPPPDFPPSPPLTPEKGTRG